MIYSVWVGEDMIEDYRNRKQKYTLDGAPIFTTKEDQEKESVAAALLEKEWDCELNHLGIYSPVDWWANRHGQPVGWVEIKSRAYSGNEKYKTELLNVRKWLSMSILNATTDLPAIFVSDVSHKGSEERVVRWIPVSQIDANSKNWRIIKPKGGIVKSRNDREPCILVPHGAMKEITQEEK
jgi:hypothetical protein